MVGAVFLVIAAAAFPAAITGRQLLSAPFADIVEITAVTSPFAALLAFHSVTSRDVFALTRKSAAPKMPILTRIHHGSPHIGSVVQTLAAVLVVGVFTIAGADPVLELFAWMSGLAAMSILSLMILSCVATIASFMRSKVDNRLWHNKIDPAMGWVGVLAIFAPMLDESRQHASECHRAVESTV
ncbi:hypothetical protein ACFVWF_29555 [Rhodococcus qingshengii]|uniref:hypothetical protein n=1 Tax=Rhodococcus qingshengii TaxID=334542 RepID=UPI0036DDED79